MAFLPVSPLSIPLLAWKSWMFPNYLYESYKDHNADALQTVDEIPISDYSIFDKPRLFSSTLPSLEKATAPYNFITFLAVAQKLQIPFLPITWQPERPYLGRGGTSQVNQSLINLPTNFAFKRVAEKDKLDKPEEEIFRRLINEIIMLRHLAVQAHPNILELQGLCWDIPSKEHNNAESRPPNPPDNVRVWPVFVFEMSHFEDLYHFASRPIGRELGINERWKICLDIGSAIAYMQSHSMYLKAIRGMTNYAFNRHHSWRHKTRERAPLQR
jgi:hypothetical protein